MINGAVLTLGALLVIAVLALPRTKRARNAAPVITNQPKACTVTGCNHPGWIPVTRADTGTIVRACHGHYPEGQLRGWWTA